MAKEIVGVQDHVEVSIFNVKETEEKTKMGVSDVISISVSNKDGDDITENARKIATGLESSAERKARQIATLKDRILPTRKLKK